MDDIVKPLWDAEVLVTGVRRGRRIELRNIDEANEEDREDTASSKSEGT